MSGRRVSSSRRKTRSATVKKQRVVVDRPVEKPKLHRFIGVSLSGGKSDKACVAVLEYFPEHQKIFLARMYEKIRTEEFISADLKIHEIITQFHKDVEFVAFDAPLSLPKCVACPLTCLGYETCTEPEVEWMRQHFAEVHKGKKPKKMFTPYTQRCVEAYIGHSLEEPFEIQHALGANMAPLTARALFLKRRIEVPCVEVYPRLSIWRLGQQMKVAKSHLKFHKHVVGGDESRKVFLQNLVDRKGVFLYQQDLKAMVENNHAFEAFICGYTAFLKFMGQTEQRPAYFPKSENWIEFPIRE